VALTGGGSILVDGGEGEGRGEDVVSCLEGFIVEEVSDS